MLVKFDVMIGGKIPQKSTEGAAGYDVFAFEIESLCLEKGVSFH